MSKHIVIDGNAFYEVDEDCLRKNNRQADGGGDLQKNAGNRTDTGREAAGRSRRTRRVRRG